MVFKRGKLAAKDGELLDLEVTPQKIPLRGSINVKFLTVEDFQIPASGKRVRAIRLLPKQIKTPEIVAEVRNENGLAVSDPDRDIVKVVVVERHHASDNIGRGFLKGLGLKRGAIASSVSHDSHNIVVAGINDSDMLEAVIEICRMKGGLAIVCDGKVLARLPLPVAGLMSEEPMVKVKVDLERMDEVARSIGVNIDEPFMALSFVTLAVVPDLKLTDLGLLDVRKFEFVNVFVD
jgi:adenine deaminase